MAAEQVVASLKANPISVACGALALTLGVGIYLRSDRVPEREALLEQKTTLGERIDANIKNGVQLAEQFTAISAARQQIESRLVHPEEIAQNLQFFYRLESETGIKLIDLRQNVLPGKSNAKGRVGYVGIGYAMTVRGDYARLLDFLHRLESNQRFCRVMTASMTASGSTDKDRGGELTLSLALELLGQP